MNENVKKVDYEKLMNRIKDIKLEDMSSEDVFDRYVGYGEINELEEPEIQKLLIKHGYVEELITLVRNVVTDKQVIKDILASNLFEDKNIILKKGKIDNIKFVEDKELKAYRTFFDFIDKDSSDKFIFEGHISFDTKDIERIKNELNFYQNSITAILENRDKKLQLLCFLKNTN